MKSPRPKPSNVVAMPRPKGKKPPSEDDGHSEVIFSFGGQNLRVNFDVSVDDLTGFPVTEVKQMPKRKH